MTDTALDRRHLLKAALAGTALTAVPALAQPASEDARLHALLDAFWIETLDSAPQLATSLGLDTGARAGQRARLNDASRAGRDAFIAARADRLRRLGAIDRARLSPRARVDFDVVVWQARTISEGGRKFRFGEGADGFGYIPYSPYAVSQLTGPYQSVPDFLDSAHPVQTTADAEAWLARMAAYPASLDASTEALKTDAALGVLAPDFALDLTIAQLERQRAGRPEDSRLAAGLADKAARAGLGGDWRARAGVLVAQRINPALDRQIAAVRALRAKARSDAGIWTIRDGDAYYAGALAFQTTTALTPQEVHRLGLDQVADLTAQLDPLLKAAGLAQGSVGARLVALGRRPDQLFAATDAGRAELLRFLNGEVARLWPRLARVFTSPPTGGVEIVRVPPDIQDGAPNGYAQTGTIDGSRPGRFYINLKDTAEWPRFTLPTLVWHEAVPGHVWQGDIAQKSADIPMLRRFDETFSAYTEGWGLYAEDLAAELGAYEGDPLGEIGHLQSLLFRAVRMVVDTGIHALRWSREQATRTMVEATGFAPGRAQREIDRYCVWPGQACSYKVGHTEWLRLRAERAARDGAAFDLKRFHDVLGLGSMPLTVLRQVVLG